MEDLEIKNKRYTKEDLSGIIEDYKKGMSFSDIGKKYGRSRTAIMSKLDSIGVYKRTNPCFTEDDIEFLKKEYPKRNWDAIKERFPDRTKESICTKMSSLGIKMTSYKWTKEEIVYLKDNIGKIPDKEIAKTLGRTVGSIRTKALKYLGYYTPRYWTEEELQILRNTYESEPMEIVVKSLPNRGKDSIIRQAKIQGLKAYERQLYIWKDWQIDFLLKNWEVLPDELIGRKIGKERKSVKNKRNALGLLRQQKGVGMAHYESLTKYIRGNIYDWKKDSMKKCNYCCIFTGSKDFQIHHLYGVSNILSDLITKNKIDVKADKDDYTKNELDTILNIFKKEQSKYPLGVCISKEIHVLFHSMYGQYYNTPQQWEQFEKDFKDGLYDDFISIKKIA